MRRYLIPGLVALFIVCTASTCKNSSSNDFLAKLYDKAYTTSQPLKTEKDVLFEPLIGYWNLSDDRPVVITKKDEKTYEFRFMSPYLNGSDIVYEAQINRIGGKNYLSMRGYKDAYMYFKVKMSGKDSVNMLMINSSIQFDGKTLPQFLAAHPGASDTSVYFTNVPMSRLTQQGAHDMQMNLMRKHVRSIEEFEEYVKLFPEAKDLDQLKKDCLEYSLNDAYTIAMLADLASAYPEMRVKAIAKAKSKCDDTKTCVDFVVAFPNDPAKDSVKNVAYIRAKNKDDYKLLIHNFPDDRRTDDVIYELGLEEFHERGDASDPSDLVKDYENIPAVIQAVNSFRAFRNFQLGESAFVPNSYLLTESGKNDLDKVAELVTASNQQHVIVKNVYFSLYNDFNYGSDNASANFFQSANKCKVVKEYLDAKNISGVEFHVIPMGAPGAGTYVGKECGAFSIDREKAREWGNVFVMRSGSIKQNPIIPNGRNELTLDHFIRVPAIEDEIINEFTQQIALYKKKSPVKPVIPANYFSEAYSTSQPGFTEFNTRLLAVAKANKLRKKRIPLFVIQ